MLPALMTRRCPTIRSNSTWVWPQTTTAALTWPKTAASRSAAVTRVKISLSLRGVAWQKSAPNFRDVEVVAGRPSRDGLPLIGSQLPRSPLDDLAVRLRHLADVTASKVRGHDALPIAVDEPDRNLARHQSQEDVTTNDDQVDARVAHLLKRGPSAGMFP